jgi:hypothetical protein
MTELIDFASPDEWPSAVARYLLGKQNARLVAVAKEAIGLSGMPNADWRRLAGIMLGLGWRCRIVDGRLVWSPEH